MLTRQRRLLAQVIGVAGAGGALALVATSLSSAATYGHPYAVSVQSTTVPASGSVSGSQQCGDIPPTDEGWAFVVPNPNTVFVTLTVTFKPGGTHKITRFGPPDGSHAFAGSAPGAQLTSASALVKTATGASKAGFFTLSHVCAAIPATAAGPALAAASPSASQSASSPASPTAASCPTASSSPSPSPSPSASRSPTASPSPTPLASVSASPAPSPCPSTSSGSSGSLAPTPTPVHADLAVTG